MFELTPYMACSVRQKFPVLISKIFARRLKSYFIPERIDLDLECFRNPSLLFCMNYRLLTLWSHV